MSIEYLDRIVDPIDPMDYEMFPNVRFHTPENISFHQNFIDTSIELTSKVRRRLRFFSNSRESARIRLLLSVFFPDAAKKKNREIFILKITKRASYQPDYFKKKQLVLKLISSLPTA